MASKPSQLHPFLVQPLLYLKPLLHPLHLLLELPNTSCSGCALPAVVPNFMATFFPTLAPTPAAKPPVSALIEDIVAPLLNDLLVNITHSPHHPSSIVLNIVISKSLNLFSFNSSLLKIL